MRLTPSDNGSSSSSRFDGAVDDVRFYSHALSEGDVSQLAAVPIPPTVLMFGLGLLVLAGLRRTTA